MKLYICQRTALLSSSKTTAAVPCPFTAPCSYDCTVFIAILFWAFAYILPGRESQKHKKKTSSHGWNEHSQPPCSFAVVSTRLEADTAGQRYCFAPGRRLVRALTRDYIINILSNKWNSAARLQLILFHLLVSHTTSPAAIDAAGLFHT